MTTELLFSSPVHYGFVSAEAFPAIDAEIEAVLPKIRAKDLTSPWGDSVATSFKYGSFGNDIAEHSMSHLATAIYTNVVEYLRSLNANENSVIEIKESWFNFYTKGQYQQTHTHPGIDVCAVYYHKAIGDEGDLFFSSPTPAHGMSNMFRRHLGAVSVQQQVRYKPEAGKILVFPAYLQHGVLENRTDHERISIATNLTVSMP